MYSLFTKLITWPVLPPTPAKLLLSAEPALLSFAPAEVDTRERPSCALLAVSWVACLALLAPEAAASEVLEAVRRWMSARDWRRANRGVMRADIVYERGCEVERLRCNGAGVVISLEFFAEVGGSEELGACRRFHRPGKAGVLPQPSNFLEAILS